MLAVISAGIHHGGAAVIAHKGAKAHEKGVQGKQALISGNSHKKPWVFTRAAAVVDAPQSQETNGEEGYVRQSGYDGLCGGEHLGLVEGEQLKGEVVAVGRENGEML